LSAGFRVAFGAAGLRVVVLMAMSPLIPVPSPAGAGGKRRVATRFRGGVPSRISHEVIVGIRQTECERAGSSGERKDAESDGLLRERRPVRNRGNLRGRRGPQAPWSPTPLDVWGATPWARRLRAIRAWRRERGRPQPVGLVFVRRLTSTAGRGWRADDVALAPGEVHASIRAR